MKISLFVFVDANIKLTRHRTKRCDNHSLIKCVHTTLEMDSVFSSTNLLKKLGVCNIANDKAHMRHCLLCPSMLFHPKVFNSIFLKVYLIFIPSSPQKRLTLLYFLNNI